MIYRKLTRCGPYNKIIEKYDDNANKKYDNYSDADNENILREDEKEEKYYENIIDNKIKFIHDNK